jgi:hypothetical protein
VAGGVDGLLESIAVDEVSRDGVSGAVTDFEAGVAEALEQSASASGSDPDYLATGIRSAFDGLVSSLIETLTPPEEASDAVPAPENEDPIETVPDALPLPAPGVDGEIGDPSDTPEAPSLEELITALVDSFEQSLASLITDIADARALAEPSPPRGNGVAYNKFLAIYNELRGVSGTVDDIA